MLINKQFLLSIHCTWFKYPIDFEGEVSPRELTGSPKKTPANPRAKQRKTTVVAFSDGGLYAPLPEKTIPDNFIERHIPSVYVSARTFTTTMSFVLVSDRASSFWKTEIHVDSSIFLDGDGIENTRERK